MKKKEEEIVVRNPVYKISQKSPLSEILNFAPLFSGITFNEEDVLEKILKCIDHYSDQRQGMVDAFLKLREKISPKNLERFNELMALVFLNTKDVNFVYLFLEKSKMDRNFIAISIVSKCKDKYVLLKKLACFTENELLSQHRDTLFREDWLSSSICREFGSLVWKKELDEISKCINKQLKQVETSSLCWNETNLNVESFEKFATIALKKIFEMKIPEEMKQMLKERRKLIIHFLQKNLKENEDLKESSRVYLAEILTLRILNPRIVSLTEDPTLKKGLIHLTKVIQHLAGETLKNENTAVDLMFDRLFHLYIGVYRDFIDEHSL